MQTLMIDKVAIHYRWQWVSPSAPVLVFTNSLGTDFRIWDGVVDRLTGHFNILLHDKRGHGLSDMSPEPVRMADFISDLEALIDHHKISSAILCGLSIGGIISIGLAAKRPDLVRAMVLCNTAPKVGTAEGWAERIALVSSGGMASISEMVLARWFTPGFRSHDNPLYHLARNMLLRQQPRGYIETCAAIGDTDFRPEARQLVVPTLCIAGDHDQATPPELVAGMAAMIPGSRYHLIRNSGHIPCLEQPGELAGLIDEFAATLASSGGA